MIEWKEIEDELPVGEKVDVLISFFHKITKKKYIERFWFYGKHASFADYDKSERKCGCIIFHPVDYYEACCVGDSTNKHNLVLTHWAYIDEPKKKA